MKGGLKIRTILSISVMILLAMFLAACGGGGGGGGGGAGDGESPPEISYTGLTTQATIDEDNAADLLGGAYAGGRLGSAFIGLGSVQTGEVSAACYPRTLKISQVLEDALLRVDFVSASGSTLLGIVVPYSGTIDGDCGGSGSYTVYVDIDTGEFSGSITFHSYCNEGTTISGYASFSGLIDPDTLPTVNLLQFRFSFNSLAATSGSDSFTYKGKIEGDLTDPSHDIITMDPLLLRDNNTEKVYQFIDYTMSITEDGGCVEIGLSDRYFDPDEGYVDISNISPFGICGDDDWPSSGVLVITGASNTKARLTALSPILCQVEADTDGNGSYDWVPPAMNWSDL